jgi:CopG family nickel-responsive transcriptional regulator
MERITMSLDEQLAKDFDALIAARGYTSRSEAMRDLLRREIESQRHARDDKSHCVASLSYVYNHHARNLAKKLTEAQHAQHDLVVATMHVHLDHEHCLESVVLKGPAARVTAFVDLTEAERGVRHVGLNLVTVDATDSHAHAHGAGARYHHHHQGHQHLIPRS